MREIKKLNAVPIISPDNNEILYEYLLVSIQRAEINPENFDVTTTINTTKEDRDEILFLAIQELIDHMQRNSKHLKRMGMKMEQVFIKERDRLSRM